MCGRGLMLDRTEQTGNPANIAELKRPNLSVGIRLAYDMNSDSIIIDQSPVSPTKKKKLTVVIIF